MRCVEFAFEFEHDFEVFVELFFHGLVASLHVVHFGRAVFGLRSARRKLGFVLDFSVGRFVFYAVKGRLLRIEKAYLNLRGRLFEFGQRHRCFVKHYVHVKNLLSGFIVTVVFFAKTVFMQRIFDFLNNDKKDRTEIPSPVARLRTIKIRRPTANKQAVQGIRTPTTGAYTPVRDRGGAQYNAAMRRLYAAKQDGGETSQARQTDFFKGEFTPP